MNAPSRGPRLRLWLVALTLFAGGFAARLILDAQEAGAFSYPYAIVFQVWTYGLGLAVWAMWCATRVTPGRYAGGCLLGLLLAIAAFVAILTSIPK
jgi:hypothetical protein